MGYTTKFTGKFAIVMKEDSDADDFQLELAISTLEAWLCRNHAGLKAAEKYGISTRWCDWMVTVEGVKPYLKWNGSEKSYNMYEWLHFINDKFLAPAGLTLEGMVYAQGEEHTDQWAISIVDGRPLRMVPVVSWRPDIKDELHGKQCSN